jgi:hypothetical protein
MHWLRSWKHVNARSVRKIKRMTPLHLLHPQLSESDVLDGARSNRNANRIAKFWKKTWFCPGLCQIAIKSKTADSKSAATHQCSNHCCYQNRYRSKRKRPNWLTRLKLYFDKLAFGDCSLPQG